MALIKCPECGKEVSTMAATCPNCGFPIKEQIENKVKAEECVQGGYVNFGHYPQGKDGEAEPIEWRVLAREENRALLISRHALLCGKFNEQFTDITWERCTLREWLNTEFINNAFSETERMQIPVVTVTAGKNPKHNINPGFSTRDKVFLLSIQETEKYFKDNEDRKCAPTAYAAEHGAETSSYYKKDGKATCWWWLRSPGLFQNYFAFVDNPGSVYHDGDRVHRTYGCVRPALWVNLDD